MDVSAPVAWTLAVASMETKRRDTQPFHGCCTSRFILETLQELDVDWLCLLCSVVFFWACGHCKHAAIYSLPLLNSTNRLRWWTKRMLVRKLILNRKPFNIWWWQVIGYWLEQGPPESNVIISAKPAVGEFLPLILKMIVLQNCISLMD